MAQNKSSQPNPETKLIISNFEFKTKLQERVKQGEQLKTEIEEAFDVKNSNNDYRDWSDYNLELLKRSFNYSKNEFSYSYDNAGYSPFGQLGEVERNPQQTLINLLDYKLRDIRSLLNRSDLIPSEIKSSTSPEPIAKSQSNEVFVVHGHDDAAKVNVARFLERLKLKPIILHEQPNSGTTIIEKIEKYSNVGFAIVLYTQCDVGGKDANSLLPRARQNVVFEHGYLIGKIGRSNVCALVKGEVETPGDISGVVYTVLDANEAWHYKLAKELRASGYSIDMNML